MDKMRVAFMGSPRFAVPALEALLGATGVDLRLVVTQPDKPAGRGRKLQPPPVKEVALRAGVPVVQPPSLRKPPLADDLRPLALDLIVVVAYGKILPPDLLAVPRLGCWNLHASLLPKYRGAAPIQWAIIEGESTTGVTLMQMEAGLDTGPMLLRQEVPIAEDDTAGTLFDKLAPVGATLLLEGLERVAGGALVGQPQDDSRATLAPMLEKEQGRVDWTRPARRVRDLIRGVDPWPGAFTTLEGEVLKMWRARLPPPGSPEAHAGAGGGPVPEPPAPGPPAAPGTIVRIDEQGLWVACGQGVVIVGEGQMPGRQRMPMAALAGGQRIRPGRRLAS